MKKILLGAFSLLSLALCLASPFLYVRGNIDAGTFKTVFLAASLAWFVLAALWQSSGKSRRG